MILKNNILHHFKIWSFHVFGSLLIYLTLFILNFETDPVKFFSIIWLIYTIPAVYLYIEYLFVNIGVCVEVSNEVLNYHKSGRVSVINKYQIESITYYMSPNSYKNSNIQYFPIESFRFVRIITKTGDKILITNLLSKNLEKDLSTLNIPIIRKKRLFCTTGI